MRDIFLYWHKFVACLPAGLAKAYLLMLSYFARNFLHGKITKQIRNSVNAAIWPDMKFSPLSIRVGNGSELKIIPHLGEFDGDALFTKNLNYEAPIFIWLEQSVSRYDVIIEIGANVGIYTCFLGKLLSGTDAKLIAFEPSPTAFTRLQKNLDVNSLPGSIAFPAAVAETTGWVTLYEPTGHLTNGSLNADFASIFSDQVNEATVAAVDRRFLDGLVNEDQRVLLKIDVEDYEPALLSSLEAFINKHRPDIIIEVLSTTEQEIRLWLESHPYRACLFTESGLQESDFSAKDGYRDWLLENTHFQN